MAKEALYFPETEIPTMVAIIRAGLEELEVEDDVRKGLSQWCDEMIAYWNHSMTAPAKFPARKRPALKSVVSKTTRKDR